MKKFKSRIFEMHKCIEENVVNPVFIIVGPYWCGEDLWGRNLIRQPLEQSIMQGSVRSTRAHQYEKV